MSSATLGFLANLFDVAAVERGGVELYAAEEHGLVDVLGLWHFVVERDGAVVFEVGHVANLERAGVGGAGDIGGVFEHRSGEALRVLGVDLEFL